MTPRRRAIIIVILAVLLIAVIIAAIVLLRRAVPSAQVPTPIADDFAPTPEQAATAEIVQNPLVPAVGAPAGRTAAAQMAELFAERFGSYSNQVDYQNLYDLLPVMTASYRAETEATLRTAKAQQGQTFEGVTSVKVSTDTRSYNAAAGTAVVAVTLQQEKTSGTSTVIGYRTLRMELEREGEAWKVDAARWENELTPAS